MRFSRSAYMLPAAVMAAALCGCSGSTSELERQWSGKTPPDFKLANLDGKVTSLSQFRGKPVLLAFWGHG